MRAALGVILMCLLPGCLVAIDDGYLPDVGPGHDGGSDGGADGAVGDGGPQVDGYWPFEHDPEDCPEEAARAREVCDPRCDGVSHFYCVDRPSDPCCACLNLGGGGGGDGDGGGRQPEGGRPPREGPPLPPPPR